MALDAIMSTRMQFLRGHRTFFLFRGEGAGTVGSLRRLGGRDSTGRGRRELGKVRRHSGSRSRIADGMAKSHVSLSGQNPRGNDPYVVPPPPAAPPPMPAPAEVVVVFVVVVVLEDVVLDLDEVVVVLVEVLPGPCRAAKIAERFTWRSAMRAS